MDQIQVAVQEAVLETKEYAKSYANHVRSVGAIPFYGFCEGTVKYFPLSRKF